MAEVVVVAVMEHSDLANSESSGGGALGTVSWISTPIDSHCNIIHHIQYAPITAYSIHHNHHSPQQQSSLIISHSFFQKVHF